MEDYFIFDAHCDTLTKKFGQNMYNNSVKPEEREEFEAWLKNDAASPEVLSKCGKRAQIFAIFIDKKASEISPFAYFEKIYENYKAVLRENESIMAHCETAADIENVVKNGRVASILSVEGGEIIEGKIENLHKLYDSGVRLMTLTWNYSNEIADGILENKNGGLTDFGRDVIREMEKIGMIVDVSHLSEKSFWDVAKVAKKPFCASHSNARKICENDRNLTDDQICAIIKAGGVIGINFFAKFLNNVFTNASIDDIISNVDYILGLGGENNIGFGSDFDGIYELPKEITAAKDVKKIVDRMKKMGYNSGWVRGICGENFLRLFRNCA